MLLDRARGWTIVFTAALALAMPTVSAADCSGARGRLEAGLLDEARAAYGAVEIEEGKLPDCVREGVDLLAVRYRELADAQLGAGETEGAKVALLKALVLRPEDAATQASLASLLEALDQDAFREVAALERAGDHTGAWSKAQEVLKAGVELPPDLVGLFENYRDSSFDKARILASAGDLAEARKAAEETVGKVGGPLPTDLEFIYGTPLSRHLFRWLALAAPLVLPLLALVLISIAVGNWIAVRKKILVDAFAVAKGASDKPAAGGVVIEGEDFAHRVQHSLAALGGLESGQLIRTEPVEIPVAEVVGAVGPAVGGLTKIISFLVKVLTPNPFRLSGMIQRPGPLGPGLVVQLTRGNRILASQEFWLKDYLGEGDVGSLQGLDPFEGYAVLSEVIAVWILSQWYRQSNSRDLCLLGSKNWRAIALFRAGSRVARQAIGGHREARLQIALEQFEEALQEDEAMFSALHNLGRVLWQQGEERYDRLGVLFRRTRQLLEKTGEEPSSTEELLALAAALFPDSAPVIEGKELRPYLDKVGEIAGQRGSGFDSQRLIFYFNASYGELAKATEVAIRSPKLELKRAPELVRDLPRELVAARRRLEEVASPFRTPQMRQWDEAALSKVSAVARSLCPVVMQLGWLEVESGALSADVWIDKLKGDVEKARVSFDALFVFNIASMLDSLGQRLSGELGGQSSSDSWQGVVSEIDRMVREDTAKTRCKPPEAEDRGRVEPFFSLAGSLLKRSLELQPNRWKEVEKKGAFAEKTKAAARDQKSDKTDPETPAEPATQLSELALISDEMSSALAKLKISTTSDLLVATADRSRRERLAKALGFEDSGILKRWADAAELLDLSDLDIAHCNLLLKANIDSLEKLQTATPPVSLKERFDALSAVAKASGAEVEIDLDLFSAWVDAADGLQSIVR